MKIISHNINGLNAYVNNEKLTKLLSDYPADIYCFQEVKCSSEDKIKKLLGKSILDEYNIYNSINTFKKGYAGVTTLIKKNIDIKYSSAVNPENINMSGYAEGRLMVTELNDFILLNIYSVNSGGEEKTKDRILYEMWLASYIKVLQTIKPVIVCGDLNVCGTELDYWGKYENAKDTCPGLMNFEIKFFNENLQINNLIDGFRHIHGEERKYSWFTRSTKKNAKQPWETRHGWRLDYFLISDSLKHNIVECDVLEAWQKFDHSPIILELNY